MIDLQPGEGKLVAWAFLCLFAVFSSYYVIRPIRDETGIAGGVSNLPWLFTDTLLCMMAVNPAFSALVRRLPRIRFISIVYRFFVLNLLVFLVLFRFSTGPAMIWTGRVFFIWTSIFNLFVVSVFWAFMVDMFNCEQGKRLFGPIAAAATLGGISGAGITAVAVKSVVIPTLLILAAVLIEIGIFGARRLGKLVPLMEAPSPAEKLQPVADAPIGGGVIAGFTNALRNPYLLQISVYMLMYTILSTFLYFEQAKIVDHTFTNRAARTAFFARIDLMVNLLTLGAQLFLTGRIMKRAGVGLTLTFVPALTAAGFLLVGFMPVPALVIGFIVLRRTGNFAFARPTREVLFTVLSREDKYKTKNFIDTVVYRLGDQVGAWSSTLVAGVGLGTGSVAWTAVPLALAWVGNAWWLGLKQEKQANPAPEPGPEVQ